MRQAADAHRHAHSAKEVAAVFERGGHVAQEDLDRGLGRKEVVHCEHAGHRLQRRGDGAATARQRCDGIAGVTDRRRWSWPSSFLPFFPPCFFPPMLFPTVSTHFSPPFVFFGWLFELQFARDAFDLSGAFIGDSGAFIRFCHRWSPHAYACGCHPAYTPMHACSTTSKHEQVEQ